MTHRCSERLASWTLGAAIVIAAASPAAAGCEQVNQLVAQGLSIGQVAAALGAPVGAVQACLQPVSMTGPRSRASFSAPGPPPLGAPGPPPLGAAGPPPLGAPGPPPLGAAGPPPAAGAGRTTR